MRTTGERRLQIVDSIILSVLEMVLHGSEPSPHFSLSVFSDKNKSDFKKKTDFTEVQTFHILVLNWLIYVTL